jgi:putative acetyltransferase
MIAIREETQRDETAIAEVNRAAFGGDIEAHIVDRLRAEGLAVLSLVATSGDQVVGHILFSDLDVDVDGRRVPAVSLAPMAVLPDWQRQGVGSRLIEAGLAGLRAQGKAHTVIVLGHPGYYPRFGFSADLAQKLQSPYAGEAFMALELVPGALSGAQGTVRYPPAFDDA